MKFVARRGEELLSVEVERKGSGYLVRMGDRELEMDLTRANGALRSLRLRSGRQFLLTHQREGTRHSVSFGGREVQVELLDPLALKRSATEGSKQGQASITAVMPGRVVRILVNAGAEVRSGDGLLILEAMKMENEIIAPQDGRVRVIHVSAGQTVETGAELLELEYG